MAGKKRAPSTDLGDRENSSAEEDEVAKATERSKSGKKQTKKVQEVVDESEEDEEEEEYEIEAILDAKKGVFKDDLSGWGYKVRWKNYGPEEDSWVRAEDAEGAKALIEEYMKVHRPGRKSMGSAKKAAPRKSNSSAKPTSISSDDDTTTRSKKRGRVSAIPVDASDVEEDPKPTKKKAKTQTPSSKAPLSKNHSNKRDMEPKTSPEPMAEDATLEMTHSTEVSDAYMSRKNWEDLVEEIVTVERRADESLIVFWTSTEGKKAETTASVMAKKCPQKLIQFYESNLKWRPAGLT